MADNITIIYGFSYTDTKIIEKYFFESILIYSIEDLDLHIKTMAQDMDKNPVTVIVPVDIDPRDRKSLPLIVRKYCTIIKAVITKKKPRFSVVKTGQTRIGSNINKKLLQREDSSAGNDTERVAILLHECIKAGNFRQVELLIREFPFEMSEIFISMYRAPYTYIEEGDLCGISVSHSIVEKFKLPPEIDSSIIIRDIAHHMGCKNLPKAIEYMRDQLNNPVFYSSVLAWLHFYIGKHIEEAGEGVLETLLDSISKTTVH